MTGTPFDPRALGHRVHVSTTADGYAASCATCGWHTSQPTREQRRHAIDGHRAVPRTRGSHGHVSEGD